MKKLLLSLAAMTVMTSVSAQKALVLYYSETGTTKTVAQEIQAQTGADIEAVEAVEPYSGNFQETIQRSGRERESGELPALKPLKKRIADYDIVFLGYPIWFGTYALPIATLVKEQDFAGKTVVPFCTFGSGGLNTSVKELAAKQPKAEILPGYGVRAARVAAIPSEGDQFLKAGGFIEGEYVVLEDFPEQQPVSEEQSAIFDKAVGDYPMIHAKATKVASRAVPGGTEYLFTAVDLPRETTAVQTTPPPAEMQIYVLALEGEDPVFTQVLR